MQRRLAQLERDKARLTQRLQQAELIIEFQKKVSEILGIPLGSKETSEDESSTLAQRLLSGQRAVLHARSPRCPLSASMRNHQLESRMREIRPSGSEGGGDGHLPSLPTPIDGLVFVAAGRYTSIHRVVTGLRGALWAGCRFRAG